MKMKIIASLSVPFLVVLAVSILFLGCEEQELGSRRRIRLVGDENLKLKEQLELCNQENRKLEEAVAYYEEEEQRQIEVQKEAGNLAFKLLRDIDTANRKNERLTDENLQLKTRIAELESETAQRADQPDAQ